MKMRTLCTGILGLLLISGVSLSQEPASSESMSEETLLAQSSSPEPSREEPTSEDYSRSEQARRRLSRLRPSDANMVTAVFELRYFPVDDIEDLIEDIFSIDRDKIHADAGTNRLILQATEDQMKNVKALIAELDVPESEGRGSATAENLIYRVFMFEIASGDEHMKPFSLILQVPPEASTTQLLDASRTNQLQISGFCLSDERDRDGKAEILIQGKAYSKHEGLKRIVYDAIPESRIKELKWDDDETFTRNIEAAHYSRLPAQIQSHIQKFLGEDIVTVGYWFGSSSVPGEVEAPIGPWRLHLELSPESDRAFEFRIDVEVPEEISHFDRQLGRDRSDEILSNTVLARVGKPIIIGYNRQSYGTRKMGAMVILPEADTVQLNTSE